MPIRLTQNGQNVIDNKAVNTYSAILIDGATNLDIIDYSYSKSKDFGASSLTVNLRNQDGQYGVNGTNELRRGDTVELYEGLYNDQGTLEEFKKFYSDLGGQR